MVFVYYVSSAALHFRFAFSHDSVLYIIFLIGNDFHWSPGTSWLRFALDLHPCTREHKNTCHRMSPTEIILWKQSPDLLDSCRRTIVVNNNLTRTTLTLPQGPTAKTRWAWTAARKNNNCDRHARKKSSGSH